MVYVCFTTFIDSIAADIRLMTAYLDRPNDMHIHFKLTELEIKRLELSLRYHFVEIKIKRFFYTCF